MSGESLPDAVREAQGSDASPMNSHCRFSQSIHNVYKLSTRYSEFNYIHAIAHMVLNANSKQPICRAGDIYMVT